MRVIVHLDARLRSVEKVCEMAAAVVLLAIMLVVSVDVIMRYVVHRPLVWAYDLISLYLMAASVFLTLSSAYATEHHVTVDILLRRLDSRSRRVAEAATCLLALPLFVLLAWVGAARAYASWRHGDTLAGLIPWPTWIALALVPFGAGLLVVRLTLSLAGHVASVATGHDVIAVPAQPDDRLAE